MMKVLLDIFLVGIKIVFTSTQSLSGFIQENFIIGDCRINLSVGNALGAANIVFETIERKSPIHPLSEEGEKPKEVKGSIQFTNIDFHYPTRSDVSILVVNDGILAEIETHFELIDKKGIYTELVKQQALNSSSG